MQNVPPFRAVCDAQKEEPNAELDEAISEDDEESVEVQVAEYWREIGKYGGVEGVFAETEVDGVREEVETGRAEDLNNVRSVWNRVERPYSGN